MYALVILIRSNCSCFYKLSQRVKQPRRPLVKSKASPIPAIRVEPSSLLLFAGFLVFCFFGMAVSIASFVIVHPFPPSTEPSNGDVRLDGDAQLSCSNSLHVCMYAGPPTQQNEQQTTVLSSRLLQFTLPPPAPPSGQTCIYLLTSI